jgi:hypothetical protein
MIKRAVPNIDDFEFDIPLPANFNGLQLTGYVGCGCTSIFTAEKECVLTVTGEHTPESCVGLLEAYLDGIKKGMNMFRFQMEKMALAS